MNQPRISVIIPVYNVERYLGQCLESVLNQTFKDIEIICVNDSSTDSSNMILKEFADKDDRIKIVTHAENKGQAIARNTGMNYAKGEYIFFLDSDDWIREDILRKMYSEAEESQCDIVMSKTDIFLDGCLEERIELKGVRDYFDFGNLKARRLKLEEIYCQEIPSVVFSKLYRREFIDNKKLHFINKRILHEDDGFWLKCLSHCPVFSSIDETGVMYRIRVGSTMFKQSFRQNKNDLALAYIDAIMYIKNFFIHNFSDIYPSINILLKNKRIPIKIDAGNIILDIDETKRIKYKILSKILLGKSRRKYTDKMNELERIVEFVKDMKQF